MNTQASTSVLAFFVFTQNELLYTNQLLIEAQCVIQP